MSHGWSQTDMWLFDEEITGRSETFMCLKHWLVFTDSTTARALDIFLETLYVLCHTSGHTYTTWNNKCLYLSIFPENLHTHTQLQQC